MGCRYVTSVTTASISGLGLKPVENAADHTCILLFVLLQVCVMGSRYVTSVTNASISGLGLFKAS